LGGALGGTKLFIFHYTYINMAFLDAPLGGPPELKYINISLDLLQKGVLGGAIGRGSGLNNMNMALDV
jgi:hypothetical protein